MVYFFIVMSILMILCICLTVVIATTDWVFFGRKPDGPQWFMIAIIVIFGTIYATNGIHGAIKEMRSEVRIVVDGTECTRSDEELICVGD